MQYGIFIAQNSPFEKMMHPMQKCKFNPQKEKKMLLFLRFRIIRYIFVPKFVHPTDRTDFKTY